MYNKKRDKVTNYKFERGCYSTRGYGSLSGGFLIKR